MEVIVIKLASFHFFCLFACLRQFQHRFGDGVVNTENNVCTENVRLLNLTQYTKDKFKVNSNFKLRI